MNRYISKLRSLFGAERNLPEGIGCATYQRLPMVRSRSGALRLRDGRWLDLDAPELIRVHDALDGVIDFEELSDDEREHYSILLRFFGAGSAPTVSTPAASPAPPVKSLRGSHIRRCEPPAG